MDKYEFNLNVDKIKKLAAKKEYKKAAAIANKMNWEKCKDWEALATVINVQEAVGDFDEARDMAILAYNRNLGGKKLIYKLTEFFIKVRDFENAEALCEEYEKTAHHAVDRYILKYNLMKAEGASDNDLINILEEYSEQELDEKYMYELAKLYFKTGRKEECVKNCDNLVLWFQDGQYVEKAVRLKEALNVELSNVQKQIYEDVMKKNADPTETMELLFKETSELASRQKDDVEDELSNDEEYSQLDENVDDAEDGTADVSNSDKVSDATDVATGKAFGEASDEASDKQNQEAEEDSDKDDLKVTKPIPTLSSNIEVQEQKMIDIPGYKSKEEGPLSIDLVQNEQNSDLIERFKKALYENKPKSDTVNADALESPKVDKPELGTMSEEGNAALANGISKANKSLQEIIDGAKQKMADNYDKMDKEDEAEQRRETEARINEQADQMEINVPIPNYSANKYDTMAIQAEVAAGIGDYFDDEATGFSPNSKGDTAPVDLESLKSKGVNKAAVEQQEAAEADSFDDDQIEGQMDLAGWFQSMKEEKYSKQQTKEFSKAELEKYLDEKDEKSVAYEKLIAEKKAEAEAEGNEISKEELEQQAKMQMVINAVKTDLMLRTGKGIAKLEEEARKAAEKAASIEVKLVTAQIPTVSDEMLSNISDIMQEETEDKAIAAFEASVATAAVNEDTFDTQLNYADIDESDEAAEDLSDEETYSDDQYNEGAEEYDDSAEEYDEAEAESDSDEFDGEEAAEDEAEAEDYLMESPAKAYIIGKHFKGELGKIFRKYREMPGLEEQLVDLMLSLDSEMHMSNSSSGNILITGNSSSDKTDLARTIIRAVNMLYPDTPKKIAKTSGESINIRGIAKAMPKLHGTALIVESAGTIQPKRVNELLTSLEQDTDRMIVIFIDSDTEMNVLLNFNPQLSATFNHRITLKQYTVNELVEMAKRFARKRQYEVDDDALLELYLKIDKLHNVNDNIKLDDIKEIINKAIINSEKRASRRLFGGLKRKRGENGDVIFLTEADFKDK